MTSEALPALPRIRAMGKFFFEGDQKFFLKGVTYGPFKPDAEGHYLGSPQQLERDLAQMREIGLNVVRIYHVPPRWFLDQCAAAGVRVLITLPWAKHVEFLTKRKARHEIIRSVRSAVEANAGHPAIFAYLVGNEISAAMVRWLGVRRVTEFVEHLIRIARAIDPEVLFSYASFPPTEYLLPQNVDFFCFNVYLHDQRDFERYLLRLQNLAEERPLILGEFGMDTIRHREEEQAEMLGWHIDSVVKCGLAGTVFFAWTDEWFTGEQEITDWAFGIVTRAREPKKSFFALRDKLGQDDTNIPHRPLPETPLVSIIVCSYNGAKTLAACLESLGKLNYPSYEIILVDDGSTDNTAQIAAEFPNVQYIHQENHGLSIARNTGAAAAKGDVFAYTDSDCMADADWLYYLIGTLVSGDYAGVGGPNVSPPARNWIQACVAAAPGGPSHVLLTDTIAEHVPGCNMAWYRWAFESVGGFDPEYHKAGDDVDFCWRVQQAGHDVAFSPTAIVWHYRRFTLSAFRKQQQGYGEAESMLRFKHLIFFGPTGTAKWRGQIYGAPRFSWFINRADHLSRRFRRRIFPIDLSHAAIGSGRVLEQHRMVCADDFPFWARDSFCRPAHRSLPDVWRHALRRDFLHAARADRTEVRYHPGALARHVSRLRATTRWGAGRAISHGCISNARRAVSFAAHEEMPAWRQRPREARRRVYWSEEGKDRHQLLSSIFRAGRRRMALFDRYRLERMGHSDLRKFLVEHRVANGDGISRRNESADARGASLSIRHHNRHYQSGDVKHSHLPTAQSFAYRFVERDPLRFVRDLSGTSRAPLEIARRGVG